MKLQAARRTTLWLCLLVALGASATASASATAALPSYSECDAIEGPFTNPSCRELGPPDTWAIVPVEYLPGSNNGFKASISKDELRIETASLKSLTCKGGSSHGELIGSKEEKSVVFVFKACRFAASKCASPGEQPGEIVTRPLQGVLGYLEGKGTSAPTVGVSMSAESGPVLLEAMCGGVGVKLSGAVMGMMSENINVIKKRSRERFVQSAGVQDFTSFEGGSPGTDELVAEFTGSGYETGTTSVMAGLQLSEGIVWPEAVDIEA